MYLPVKYFTLPGCHMLDKHWDFLKWGGEKDNWVMPTSSKM